MAASFAYMSDSTQKFHHVIYNHLFENFMNKKKLACLPDASNLLADGLANAHKLYGNPNSKILFVVSQSEGNILDQRGLELHLIYIKIRG